MFEAMAVGVDALERPTVVGVSLGDVVFTNISADGQIDHETFWGGSLPDFVNGIAIDAVGHAYVTGETRSTSFPGDTVLNPNPFQAAKSGSADAWVIRHLRDDPIGAAVPLLPGGGAALLLVLGLGLGGALAVRRRD